MRGRGAIAEGNVIEYASIFEAGWSAASPASLAKYDTAGVAARSLTGGSRAAPVIYAGNFARRETVSVAALAGINAWQTDEVRFRLFDGANRTGPVTYDSGWRWIMPALYAPDALRWGADNLFHGGLSDRDWGTYPTNFIHVFDAAEGESFEFQIASQGVAASPDDPRERVLAGYVEIVTAWVSDSLIFERNYDFGATDQYAPGGEVKRHPGGEIREYAPGRRSVSISWGATPQGDQLFDLACRVGVDRPVIWISEIGLEGSPSRQVRYGFLGYFEGAVKMARPHYRRNATSLTLIERIGGAI